MKKFTGWLLAIIVLAAAVVGFHFWQQRPAPLPPAPPVAEAPPPVTEAPPPPQPEPPTHYPLPENPAPAEQAALPALDQSDAMVREALNGLFGKKRLAELLHPQELVRRIVVTVDNLPRQTLAVRLLPTRPVAGAFVTTGQDDELAIAPENAARYAPYVRLAEMADPAQLVALYVRFYPLFQRAYHDLGYPDGDFNDRLVVVIDHLLATPEAAAPRLTQPHVLYQFADARLEAQSAGRKILLRMGNDNAARIKAVLRKLRVLLTAGAQPPQD